MEIVDLFLPATNKFATGYYAGNPEVQQYFHYNYQKHSHYKDRVEELEGRFFLRNDLADHIADFMKPFPSSDKVEQSINKLRQDNSVVVIGGQQAGILTGPLYSIHKVISIITLAKEKEEELGIPVVPVFWIAGEDHDYVEVNHVYLPSELQLQKCVYPERVFEKRMMSDCFLSKDSCLNWAREIIETLGETEHTNEILSFAEQAILQSKTLVDFFAYLVMELFKEHGLLLVDSGNKQLRKMEKEIFLRQIESTVSITNAVRKQQAEIRNAGFSNSIDLSPNAANLFFYDEVHHERILLDFEEGTSSFIGKKGLISFTNDELCEIAREFPDKLSNNVVTRPITQELLFPTLAFIAGPGEISYWSELKQAFEQFDIKMPPIVPRITITLLERNLEADLSELELELKEVLQSGVADKKLMFLNSVRDKDFEALFAKTKEQLQQNYQIIKKKTQEEHRGLVPLLMKNESLLIDQIAFMEEKIEEAIQLKHRVQLNKFDRVENSLRPSGGPQERTWNIFYFLNKFGLGFVNELTKLPFKFDGNHKVVKL